MLHPISEAGQSGAVDELTAYLDDMVKQEAELRSLLRAASKKIRDRDAQIDASLCRLQTAVEAIPRHNDNVAASPEASLPASPVARHTDYQQLIRDIHEIVPQITSPHANVLVVSRGDNALLQFDGRQGWHFPQTAEGLYAGYHPADSDAAIAHLEELKSRGAHVVLFPSTAFWWLDYYGAFREHLDANYQCIWSDERCRAYELASCALQRADLGERAADAAQRRDAPDSPAGYGQLVDDVADLARRGFPPGTTVIIVSSNSRQSHQMGSA